MFFHCCIPRTIAFYFFVEAVGLGYFFFYMKSWEKESTLSLNYLIIISYLQSALVPAPSPWHISMLFYVCLLSLRVVECFFYDVIAHLTPILFVCLLLCLKCQIATITHTISPFRKIILQSSAKISDVELADCTFRFPLIWMGNPLFHSFQSTARKKVVTSLMQNPRRKFQRGKTAVWTQPYTVGSVLQICKWF